MREPRSTAQTHSHMAARLVPLSNHRQLFRESGYERVTRRLSTSKLFLVGLIAWNAWSVWFIAHQLMRHA